MKNLRPFMIGLFTGIFLMLSATAFAAGGISEITAYIRDGFRFIVNGEQIELVNPPIVYNNRTYLPVRELAELLNHDVNFTDNTIMINQKPGTKEVGKMVVETKMTGRDLVELLAKKYPQYVADATKPQISLAPDGTLRIGEISYQVAIDANGYVDVSPLLEAGVLSSEDVQ